MSDSRERVKLELVRAPQRTPVTEDRFAGRPTQKALFPVPKQDLLVFVSVSRVTEEEFTKTLEMARPRVILELRRSPRFDIGSMNRRLAFRWFDSLESKYYDLSSLRSQEGTDPETWVQTFLERPESQVEGPILLLISDPDATSKSSDEYLIPKITSIFTSALHRDWETVHVPHFA